MRSMQWGITVNSVEDSSERFRILLPRSLPGLEVNNLSQFSDREIDVWRLCTARGCNSFCLLLKPPLLFPFLRVFCSVNIQLTFPRSGVECLNLGFRFLKLQPELRLKGELWRTAISFLHMRLFYLIIGCLHPLPRQTIQTTIELDGVWEMGGDDVDVGRWSPPHSNEGLRPDARLSRRLLRILSFALAHDREKLVEVLVQRRQSSFHFLREHAGRIPNCWTDSSKKFPPIDPCK